jgi:hypothetical protein
MARRIDDEQKAKIVELRLQRLPVRSVAKEVGVSVSTVDQVYKAWLAEESPGAVGGMRDLNNETRARMDLLATECRTGAVKARSTQNHAAAARYLAVELAALTRIAAMDAIAASPGLPAAAAAVAVEGKAVRSDAITELAEARARRRARADAAPPAKRGNQHRRAGGRRPSA